MTDAELDALLVDLRPMNGCNEFDRAVDAITFLRAAQVADPAQIRADALREAVTLIDTFPLGADGPSFATERARWVRDNLRKGVASLIDTPPAVSDDVAALVDAASQYLGTIDAPNPTVTSQGMALYDLRAALAKLKGGVK